MKKKFITKIIVASLAISLLSGCGSSSQENTETTVQSEDTAAETAEEAEAAAKAEEEAAAKAAEEEAARQEEANASYEAGRAYLYGLDGKEIDLEAAYTNFENALELGKTEANFYLGLLYDWYSYPEQDVEKAKTYYEAAEDNPYAQLALGFLYYSGQGVEADTAKGKELFENSIVQGCVEGYLGSAYIAYDNQDYDTTFECYNKVLEGEEQAFITNAMFSIGAMYKDGTGIEQDYAKAMEWFEKAADLGDSSATNQIGFMYFFGMGIEQDYAKAMEWFEKAGDLGNTEAMYNIGAMYKGGIGVEQDSAKAIEWSEKAADLNYTMAMCQIADIYRDGVGVEQDYAKAMEWYKKAADLDDSTGMNQIGYMYYNGLGVEQDYAKALEWFEKAADLGHSTAMENLASMYEDGLGVERDNAKAQEWYNKAAAAEE